MDIPKKLFYKISLEKKKVNTHHTFAFTDKCSNDRGSATTTFVECNLGNDGVFFQDLKKQGYVRWLSIE